MEMRCIFASHGPEEQIPCVLHSKIIAASLRERILVVDSGKNDFCINRLMFHLGTDDKSIGHDVVDDAYIAMSISMNGGKCGFVYKRFRSTCAEKLMTDVCRNLFIGKTFEVM